MLEGRRAKRDAARLETNLFGPVGFGDTRYFVYLWTFCGIFDNPNKSIFVEILKRIAEYLQLVAVRIYRITT